MAMKSLVCLYVLVFSLQFVCGQYSTTPCPGVFDFEDDGHHVYGVITLRPVAPVSTLELRINFTTAAQLIDNKYAGRIDAVNSKTLLQRYNQGQAVSYLVHFPVTSPLPKLTTLTVNGATICYGRGDLARPHTILSLRHSSFLQRGAGAAPGNTNFRPQPQTRPQSGPQEPIRHSAVNHIHVGEDDASAHIHTFQNIEPTGTTGISRPQSVPQEPIRHSAVNHIHIGEDDASAHIHTFENIEPTAGTTGISRPQSGPQEPIRHAAVSHIHIGEDDASAHIHTFENIEPTGTTGNSPNYVVNNTNPFTQATQHYPPHTHEDLVASPNPNDNYPADQPTAVTASPERYPNTPDKTIECGTISGGNNRIPLIYNGNAYDRGELPWLVAIYKLDLVSLLFVCAGTLVSDRHIVTAAQCIRRRRTLTSIKDIVVKVGVHNLNDWSDDITIIRTLQAATIHEAYNPITLQNDIVMLILDKRVKFNQNIRPACLWSGNTDLSVIVGRKGVVAGWGDQGEGGVGKQGEPHKVDIPIVSTRDCRASKPLFRELTDHTTLCAGDRQGSGPCVGDSGGGMYLLQDGKWRVRGVVSMALRADNGDSTCNLDEYVVFTDVAQFLPWIKNILARN